MANNPGKPGKAHPDIRRAEEQRLADRSRHLEELRKQRFPHYAAYCEERTKYNQECRRLARAKFTEIWQVAAMDRYQQQRMRRWEKRNPNPLTWEEYISVEREG
jgi:hypothetical protein